ncbi:MAG: formate/nitrite transporter family protein [Metamycoplasmataceae bacterium]
MHDYKDNFSNAIEFAVKKTNLAWWKLIFLGIMGCIYVGIAYIAFIAILAGTQDKDVFVDGWKENLLENNIAPNIDIKGWPLVVAGAIFPVGLLLIVFLGGSLFTSDNLTSIAILTQKVKVSPVVIKWALTLFGNILGAFLIAGIARGANIFDDKQLFILQQIIAKKVNIEWWQAFFSGILCNILVAGTVWSTMATKHSIAKIFLIYFPIWLFAIVGFQHVTANSILFAFGWAHLDNPIFQSIGQGVFDAPISLTDWTIRSIVVNMLPAMCGNWISGAILLPFVYFWLSDQHKVIKSEKAKAKAKLNKKEEEISIEEQNTNTFNTFVNRPGKPKQDYDNLDETRHVRLFPEDIPNYDELYNNQEDTYPADVLVRTNETNFDDPLEAEYYDEDEYYDEYEDDGGYYKL